MSIQTVVCLAVVDKLLFFVTPNYQTSSVYIGLVSHACRVCVVMLHVRDKPIHVSP